MLRVLLLAAMAGAVVMPPPAPERNRAIWVWDAAPLLHDNAARAQFLSFCARERIARAWVQVAVDPGASLRHADRWRSFLHDAHASGLSVDALDGSPDYVLPRSRPTVMNIVNAVVAFNRTADAKSRFDGIHMDNEPYVLAGWHDPPVRERLLGMLLDVSAAIREVAAANGLGFGVDIPFWWQTIDEETGQPVGAVTFGGRRKPASFHLLDLADHVGIMGYRNVAEGRDGLIVHALPLLEYAGTARAKVFIGVETTRSADAPFWFLSGIDKARFRAVIGRDTAAERRDLAIVNQDRQVLVGLQVRGDGEETEARLSELAQQLDALVLDDEGRRSWIEARSRLANEGDWRDLSRAPIIDRQGRAYGGWKATRIMLPKLTFAGKTAAEMSRELEIAERAMARHRSFAGIAIHDYDGYRAVLAAPAR